MGITTINKDRPIIITGKTGTGKTTKAKEMLPNALVLFADSLNIIRRYRGKLVMTSLNEKDIPQGIKGLCKINRAGSKKHLSESIQEIAPRSEEPFSLRMDMFSLVNYFLKESDRDEVCRVLKVNKPSDTLLLNYLCINSNPNKLLFIDGRVRRRWSQDYFYEMLAYNYDGRFYGRLNMPTWKPQSKIPYLLRRLGIKNADRRIFKQLIQDKDFVTFAKSKLNNGDCRLMGLGEKKVHKNKPAQKKKQVSLGDYL